MYLVMVAGTAAAANGVATPAVIRAAIVASGILEDRRMERSNRRNWDTRDSFSTRSAR